MQERIDHANALRVSSIMLGMQYKPDTGFVIVFKGSNLFIQHWQRVPDCKTGEPSIQKGRKWYISPHATDEEVIRTFLLAVRQFEEHEVYENLTYNGERVLDPHPEGPRLDIRELI